MRRLVCLVIYITLVCAAPVNAQEPPPRIGPFVVDLHATVPLFPNDVPQLAESRNLGLADLPGRGFGGQVGVHVYLLRWRALTVGIGGEAIVARANSAPPADSQSTIRPAERSLERSIPWTGCCRRRRRGW